MPDERGIKINLTADDVDRLIQAMQKGRENRVNALREAGVDVSAANQGEHCGVVICGG